MPKARRLKALCHPAGSTYFPEPCGYAKPKSFRNCGVPTTAPEACVSKATRMMVQHAYSDQKHAQGLRFMVFEVGGVSSNLLGTIECAGDVLDTQFGVLVVSSWYDICGY